MTASLFAALLALALFDIAIFLVFDETWLSDEDTDPLVKTFEPVRVSRGYAWGSALLSFAVTYWWWG